MIKNVISSIFKPKIPPDIKNLLQNGPHENLICSVISYLATTDLQEIVDFLNTNKPIEDCEYTENLVQEHINAYIRSENKI